MKRTQEKSYCFCWQEGNEGIKTTIAKQEAKRFCIKSESATHGFYLKSSLRAAVWTCWCLFSVFLHVFLNFDLFFQCFFHAPLTPLRHTSIAPHPPERLLLSAAVLTCQASEDVRASAPRRCWRRNVKRSLTKGQKQTPKEKNRPIYTQMQHLQEEAAIPRPAPTATENRRKLKSKPIICLLLLRFQSWGKYSVQQVAALHHKPHNASSRRCFDFLPRALLAVRYRLQGFHRNETRAHRGRNAVWSVSAVWITALTLWSKPLKL